jgi:hypothetical protein
MLPADQARFDEQASLRTWESRRGESAAAEYQAEFNHQQKMQGLRTEMSLAAMSQQGLEIEAITAKYDAEEQLAADRLAWTLENTILEESEKSRIVEEYQLLGEQREAERQRRLLQAEQELQQRKYDMTLNFLSAAGSMTDAFQTATGNRSKAAFRVFQGVKSAETIVSTYSAVMKAWDDPNESNYYVRAGKAAAVAAAGVAAVAKIWAASPSGGGTVSAIGTTLGGSANVYGPNGQIVTQPTNGTNGQALQITVNVTGNVIAETDWIEGKLAPAIRDLVQRRNVDFGLAPA